MFIPLYDRNRLRYVKRPYVNYGLIAFTTLAFFLTGGLSPETINNAAIGLGFIPSVANGYEDLPREYAVVPETATYITYAFLHADLMHLLGNMAFLWVFGDNIEDALGHARYLVFYLLAAAGSAAVFQLMHPELAGPLIGASGAVAGVVGGYLVLHPRVRLWVLVLGRIPLGLSAVWLLGAWALFQIYSMLTAATDDAVAWWAHIGGIVVGATLVVPFRRRGVKLFDWNAPEPG
jgi:membrane associated rhomboid family serine protease